MEPSEGFPPIALPDARVLVLGSLPGQKSLTVAEYYAHPQNAFWPIMKEIFGITGDYTERCERLSEHQLALWDVLSTSVRPGSLDANIRQETATANDFASFLHEHPRIERIAFNGKKAGQLFRRMVPAVHCQHIHLVGLPSTSPAYAAMPFAGKLEAWTKGLEFIHAVT